MKISVEDKLSGLKKSLLDLGYDVYNFSENISSDAYIYSERNTGLHNLNNFVSPSIDGALLVDADGKSLEDIEYILSHRLYSPLFKVTDNSTYLV